MSICEILETVDCCQVSPLDAMASLFGRTTSWGRPGWLLHTALAGCSCNIAF